MKDKLIEMTALIFSLIFIGGALVFFFIWAAMDFLISSYWDEK